MLWCKVCRRELVGVREVERVEVVHELIEDPLVGWILGPTVLKWVSKPVETERVECGCGRFELDQIAACLEARTVEVRHVR